MNSQQTRTPFFEYFYDPPSPDVPSEYDPPFPSELGTPHSKASFDFSSRELYGDSFMNEGAKDDDIECHVSKEEEESLGMKLAALNGEDVFFHDSNLAESNGNFPESKHLDANFKLTNLRQFSSNGTTISDQVKDHLLIDQNDEEKKDICTKQSESSEMHESVITKELFTTEFPSDGHLAETSQTDRNLHKYNDVNNHIPIPCDESSSCGDAQRGKRNHISPHSGSGLTEDAESSPPNSQEFIQKCSDADILRADVPHSQNSEEINNFSSGLLYESLHSTLKEESCSNTQPTNQSGSFTSNTEVKKMSNEPPLPLENTIPLDINTRSSVPSDTFSETAHFIQHSMRDRRAFPSSSDYDGDSLRSPSPTFSSFLTESCSITPFPADCASPYSTNPTSTPLPSPIPSEMLSNLTSESSPSTPSTITSSAMLCVSRKLEGLANGASVASSNSTSKEENYDKNEFNLDFENNQLRKELNENLSPPNFRDTLISKNDKSPDNSKKLELTGDKRVSENSRASSFVNQNYHQSSFTSKGNMSSIKACEIPDHSDKMATLLNEPKQVIKPTKIPRSQAYDAHSLAQKANSNIIYCYSPVMEKANVAELKEKFMGPESTKMGKKVLKSKQISECRSGIPVHQSKDTKKQVSQDSMEETKSNTDNNPPKIQTNEPSSTKPKSPKNLSPPQPPPRLAPSFKDVPPPIPPPPAEDEDENDLPPIPKLPQKNKYLSNRALLSSPPVPPVRQYLLIPIIPGKATPILLTPPPTPKRSSSFFETSPPSRSSRPLPPTLSHPPPAPPPRQFSPVARKVDQDQYEDEERTMNGFFVANDLVPPKNGACTRYLPLGRELTPVPEEKASSASSSSSPEANDLYFLFHSSPLRDNEDLGKSPLENEERNQSCLLKPSFPPPPPPLPPSTPTDNHTFTDKSSSHSPVPSTERTPPPPLPPRQKTFKITPSLKPPPPPPPPPAPLSPPPPPKRMIGPLSGTCVSSTASSPSIVLPGLSPCRAIDRSPPNDRDFPIFSADADTTEEPKQPPRKPSSPALIIGASGQPTLPGPPPPPPPVAPPPIPPGMDSSPGGIKSGCMSVSSYGRLVIDRSDLPLPLPDEEIRKVYAAVKRWGWISSYRDTLAIYTQFRPIIQQGPQCGLVALSMASHVCQKSVPVQELLEKARAKEISCHGEMFSARAMADLATEMLKGVSASVREGVLESPSEVVKILLEGDFILFPYDSEPNHFPGFHKGMKAHWGLLCGCIVQSSGLEILRKHDFSIIKSDPQVDLLWHLRPLTKSLEEDHRPSSVPLSSAPEEVTQRGSRSVSPYSLSGDKASTTLAKEKHPVRTMLSSEFGKKEWCKDDNISNLVVLYRQGKSRNLIYTPLEDLSFSNRQLLEYPPNEGYIIGSVEVGLSKQVVVLHKEKPGLSDFLGLIQETEANQ